MWNLYSEGKRNSFSIAKSIINNVLCSLDLQTSMIIQDISPDWDKRITIPNYYGIVPIVGADLRVCPD